jgi:hypothetical protein
MLFAVTRFVPIERLQVPRKTEKFLEYSHEHTPPLILRVLFDSKDLSKKQRYVGYEVGRTQGGKQQWVKS